MLMTVKVLQLNIFTGKYLDNIVSFLNQNDFDIIQMQEVASIGFGYAKKNCFEEIKNILDYEGVYEPSTKLAVNKNAFFGCATFFKKKLNLIKTDILWMKEPVDIRDNEQLISAKPPEAIENLGRNAIILTFEINKKKISFVNTHLTWGPHGNDTPVKLEVGKILFDYVRNLNNEFVLTGDFNVDKNSQIVKWFNSIGRNLIEENGVTNTLNPRLHRAKELFPPGLGVDFAFISNGLNVQNFKIIEEDLSDHLGLSFDLYLNS